MLQAGQSNLLQSWAYGEARSAVSGWRVKRGVFHLRDEPVALVSLLQRNSAGLFSISRLTRGPLPLRSLASSEQRTIWNELAHLGNIWRGRILSAAPELDQSESTRALMAACGFRRFSRHAWESVWVDLSLEPAALRERMTGKWRRWVKDLDRPGKKGLSIEVTNDAPTFDWMIGKYLELRRTRHFSGPSVSVLEALRAQPGAEEELLVFRAFREGEPVSAIFVALHGTAATYLVGWNGPQGRKLAANQFLFWFAIQHLKQSGFRWFDLGGISEISTPGITAFKLGLGGQRYQLAGEYWKW
jgi:hypothetical protein